MVTQLNSPPLGSAAPDFTLPDTAGAMVSLADIRGEAGTVVAFICNHCPYVVAIADHLPVLAADLAELKIGFVAINSNNWIDYPQDAPERMVEFAKQHHFNFPYLVDESQDVAKSYDAVCTPDFFGFDAAGALVYRGRMDASGAKPPAPGQQRELYDAMAAVAGGLTTPPPQYPPYGCSIKWRG